MLQGSFTTEDSQEVFGTSELSELTFIGKRITRTIDVKNTSRATTTCIDACLLCLSERNDFILEPVFLFGFNHEPLSQSFFMYVFWIIGD